MTSAAEPPVEASAEHQVDIHTSAGKLADLRKRTAESLHPVGETAVEKVHAKGKLTACERIQAHLDTTRSSSSTLCQSQCSRNVLKLGSSGTSTVGGEL